MMTGISDFKWLVLLSYPFIVVMMFGVWLYARTKRTRKVDVSVHLLGMKLDLKIDNDWDGLERRKECR